MHVIRLVLDGGTAKNGGVGNYNWLRFVSIGGGAYRPSASSEIRSCSDQEPAYVPRIRHREAVTAHRDSGGRRFDAIVAVEGLLRVRLRASDRDHDVV